MSRATLALALALAVALALAAGRAAAQTIEQPAPAGAELDLGPPAEAPLPENPWSKGVSQESRRTAERLFLEGNAFLKESIVASAAEKYREAVAQWDHPAIHFNLALALILLDQPVETHRELEQAVRYGPGPLTQERLDHARNYLALLDRQLARVKVRCAVSGAKVELDGRPLFEPPGEWEGLLRAGRHAFVASKRGLLTNTSALVLEGGQTVTVDLELRSIEEMTHVTRRWRTWIPWSVVGGGAALVLGGAGFQWAGVQKVDWVDRETKARCPTGCSPEPADIAGARSDGRTYQRVAVGLYVAGAAAIATGVTLMLLNRPVTVVDSYPGAAPGAAPAAASPPRAEVAPVVSRDGVAVLATFRF